MITASQVKELRERTGAGMMDCKKVLTETNGDEEKAIELLRERGIAKAAKKADRIAAEGLVAAYLSEDRKIGAVVEVNAETDFVAKNEEFRSFVADVAKQITEKAPKTVEELLEQIQTNYGDVSIDVLTGGPPCQSFSLAGERRKNDKKDDLFSYYLKVIEAIRPKYFIMENVYGILTKDNGKVKERILKEIRNIVDYDHLKLFVEKCEASSIKSYELTIALRVLRVWIAQNEAERQRRTDYLVSRKAIKELPLSNDQKSFINRAILNNKAELDNPILRALCEELSSVFVEAYRNNKVVSEDDRNDIRQALSLIASQNDLSRIVRLVKYHINTAQLKRSTYKDFRSG